MKKFISRLASLIKNLVLGRGMTCHAPSSQTLGFMNMRLACGGGAARRAPTYHALGAIQLMLITIVLISPLQSFAQDVPSIDVDTCIAEIDNRLAQEQRIYRTVLFGLKSASD